MGFIKQNKPFISKLYLIGGSEPGRQRESLRDEPHSNAPETYHKILYHQDSPSLTAAKNPQHYPDPWDYAPVVALPPVGVLLKVAL